LQKEVSKGARRYVKELRRSIRSKKRFVELQGGEEKEKRTPATCSSPCEGWLVKQSAKKKRGHRVTARSKQRWLNARGEKSTKKKKDSLISEENREFGHDPSRHRKGGKCLKKSEVGGYLRRLTSASEKPK